MKQLIYYILNKTFHTLDKTVIDLLPKKGDLVVFDVGCYRGVFFISLLKKLKKRSQKTNFFLFDINKNVKNYLKKYISKKNIHYIEAAASHKNGNANYHYNSFFEASGSSLSNIYSGDNKWIFSRKFFLKLFFQETKDYVDYKVKTVTLDKIIESKKLKKVDVIKIDVDGSELDVLRGLKKSFKKNKIKMVLLEINERPKKNYNKKVNLIIKYFKKYNFELYKRYRMIAPELFSDIKSGDYLFVQKNNY